MAALRERLSWRPEEGAVHDGPRRYLLLRPDVLMGAVVSLPAPAQQQFLQAFAESARRHGAASLQAYAQVAQGDAAALQAATVQAAADLGWGRWQVSGAEGSLKLSVHHSPFVAGWRAAGGGLAVQPVCAPIQGLFAALAEALLGRRLQARECGCAAQGERQGEGQREGVAASCEFVLEDAP